MEFQNLKALFVKLNEIGLKNQKRDDLSGILIFQPLFDASGKLDRAKLGEIDKEGEVYSEMLTRYLFLMSVLDQGPDMEGVRIFLERIVNSLYSKGIKFLHCPSIFFKNLEDVFNVVNAEHKKIKEERGEMWAKTQNSKRAKSYNLFLENSKQISSYVMGRFGPPLSIIEILKEKNTRLLDHFKKRKSAEALSKYIKEDEFFGLGKAIGNKAAHLLIKWLIYTYGILDLDTKGWGQNSYELPLDSNAGRVLFMAGFFDYFLPGIDNPEKFIGFKNEKGDNYYIYVTRAFRGKRAENLDMDETEKIREIMHKLFSSNIRTVQVQWLVNYISEVTGSSVGAIDDGLMKIGTTYCINRGNQVCNKCEISELCKSYDDKYRKNHFHT
jgi:hypothetical protein